MKILLFAAACWTATTAGAADTDAPANYTHVMPLSAAAKQGVLQLRLPKDVYLHARSPLLDDVRVFDAKGMAQPFALRAPTVEPSVGHQDVPLTIFPLMSATNQAGQLDLDVSRAPDGELLSVKLRPERATKEPAPAEQLTALILQLGKPQRPVNALRFTLPAGQRDYSAHVWLETSDDMKRWQAVGAAELNWLVNQQAQTLTNDRLEFDAQSFRYARLTWRGGKPIQFAAVVAEQPLRPTAPAPGDQLLLPPAAGELPQELVYTVPPAIAPSTIGLQFADTNVVLPVTLGIYRTVQARQAGATMRRFEPIVSTTFYRITQDGQTRSSGDLDVAPQHAPQWVLRTATAASVKPSLRLGWQPATLIFLANGNPPYLLAVGREGVGHAASPVEQVAPGFTDLELNRLEHASAGPATLQQGAAEVTQAAALDATVGARRRLMVLWGVLLLGTGALGWMVWRLLRPAR